MINLFGAGGHAKVIIEIIKSCGKEVASVFDDAPIEPTILGIPVYSATQDDLPTENWIIAIGNNFIRNSIVGRNSFTYGLAIHSSAVISPSAQIGEGSVVMANAVINSETIIGKHCIINTGAVVEHDNILHDFVHISPNTALAGNVTVGKGSHIGTGACVIPGVKIGEWCVVGAGAVVLHDVPDYATVVGNPAQVIKIKK